MVILDLEIINFDRVLQQLMLDFFDYDILAIDEDEDIARAELSSSSDIKISGNRSFVWFKRSLPFCSLWGGPAEDESFIFSRFCIESMLPPYLGHAVLSIGRILYGLLHDIPYRSFHSASAAGQSASL